MQGHHFLISLFYFLCSDFSSSIFRFFSFTLHLSFRSHSLLVTQTHTCPKGQNVQLCACWVSGAELVYTSEAFVHWNISSLKHQN